MASSTLSNFTTTATALSNLILVSPQATQGYQPISPSVLVGPQAPKPPALLFHYEGEQTAALESDITDHYIEDNTAIQDQIALRPVMVTTHGFIGELNDVVPINSPILQAALQKLTVLTAYTPELTTAALIAYNQAFQAYQIGASAVNSAISAWSSINGTGGENVIGPGGISSNTVNIFNGQVANNQTKQQVAFQQFYAYWQARWLFTVQTPWAVFQNMAIQRMRAIQSAETNVITDFEVSFKMIRTAASAVTTPAVMEGRAANQASGPVNQGTQSLAQENPVDQKSLLLSAYPSLEVA